MRRPSLKAINWDGFAAALVAKPETRPVGEGWMTTEELMRKHKTSKKRVADAMARIPHQRFVGYINSNAKLCRQVWYRPL